MKESLAEERGSCQERLDRRLARARLETIKRKLGCSDTGAGDS